MLETSNMYFTLKYEDCVGSKEHEGGQRRSFGNATFLEAK